MAVLPGVFYFKSATAEIKHCFISVRFQFNFNCEGTIIANITPSVRAAIGWWCFGFNVALHD